jgi:uncharacterized protein (DUF427 family)
MKLPGPDHPITIAANPKRVQVLFHGHLIAETDRALTLKESTYPAVQYIPRDDAAMMYLTRTEHGSHCPYKGDASYYSIARDGTVAENAVWSYEAPYPAMDQIRGYLAFYPNQVEIVETDDTVSPEAIRDIVEHTDSGSGSSQRDHWAANVDGPGGNPPVTQPYKDTGAI